MDTVPEPFLLLEPDAAPRLEAMPALLPTAEPVRWLRSPTLAGAAILGLGIPVLWALWLASALFDRWGALGWAGLVILLSGIGLIGVGIGRELRGLSALRRVDHLRVEFASGEAERIKRAARRWLEGLPQHSAILPALTAADTPETGTGALAFGACASAARCNGGPRTKRRSAERCDRRRDPFARNGRTDRWLVRCATDTPDRSAAWDAPRHSGDTGIAAEDGLGCGDGRRCGDRRERRHSCDGVASAVATFGGRRRRRRGGSPPHDCVGSCSRNGLFTDSARLGLLRKSASTRSRHPPRRHGRRRPLGLKGDTAESTTGTSAVMCALVGSTDRHLLLLPFHPRCQWFSL